MGNISGLASRQPCGCNVLQETGEVIRECPGADKPATVGRKPCGCVVTAIVVPEINDGPDAFAEYAKNLKQWQRSGMVLEYRTVGFIRHGGLHRCIHRKER